MLHVKEGFPPDWLYCHLQSINKDTEERSVKIICNLSFFIFNPNKNLHRHFYFQNQLIESISNISLQRHIISLFNMSFLSVFKALRSSFVLMHSWPWLWWNTHSQEILYLEKKNLLAYQYSSVAINSPDFALLFFTLLTISAEIGPSVVIMYYTFQWVVALFTDINIHI